MISVITSAYTVKVYLFPMAGEQGLPVGWFCQ